MNTSSLDAGMMAGGGPSPCQGCRHYNTCWSQHSRLSFDKQCDVRLRCVIRSWFISVVAFVATILCLCVIFSFTSCATQRDVHKVAQVQQVSGHSIIDINTTARLDSIWTHDLSTIHEYTWTRTVTYYDSLGRVTAVSEDVLTERNEHKDVEQQQVTEQDSTRVTVDSTYTRTDSLQIEDRKERGDAARTGWQSFLYTLRTSWRLLALLVGAGLIIFVLRKLGIIK